MPVSPDGNRVVMEDQRSVEDKRFGWVMDDKVSVGQDAHGVVVEKSLGVDGE